MEERRADIINMERGGTGIDAQMDQLPQYVSNFSLRGHKLFKVLLWILNS